MTEKVESYHKQMILSKEEAVKERSLAETYKESSMKFETSMQHHLAQVTEWQERAKKFEL